ncbi:helix-turn-helix domain-containing protein [Sulfurospirillum multivorans]|uniref:helix-turn-helix domain-containing protein n=1 Tax=Sulfurospirillum multivorans TaxID=66821 RepID=UPI00046D57E3|nr:helix-turn-helix domain-containing protein [Sulfurospirillum multivorans]
MIEELVVITKSDLANLIKNAVKQVFLEQKLDKYANRQKFAPKEAAEFTGRKESYIRMLIRDGKIPFAKEGKPVILFRKDLLPLKK